MYKKEVKDEILKKYELFIKELQEHEIQAIGESRGNTLYCFDSNEFFTWPRGYRHNGNSIIIVDSDGMSDVPMNSDELVHYLLDEADAVLEVIRYDDRF